MGIKHLLERSFPLKVAGTSEKEKLFEAVSKDTSLIVIDYITIEGLSIDDMKRLQSAHPSVPILVITSDQNKESILEILELGVNGFLFKDCSEDEIERAVRAITTGDKFYCNRVFDILMHSRQSKRGPALASDLLTKREISILKLVVSGLPTTAIAEALHLSPHTVSTHRKNIIKKLQIKSPMELVTYAYDLGLIERPA